MTATNELLQDLKARGLIAQCTADEELAEHLSTDCRTLYCGFDPTADSLHIGSLVPLLVLKRFQQAGHKPLALVGGATGLIGDPSFKAAERQLNTSDVVGDWVNKIRAQVSAFVEFTEEKNGAEVVNNLDWIGEINVIEFMRDIGKHFSVNAMIQKESVKQRIDREGSGISFTEFSYMLLQSYDFAALNKAKECTLQIGGSDQWGNITGGIDLTRRMNRNKVFGLTLPLVTKSDGTKFGKTESGTIWLDPSKTSPYAFYQFWLGTADADVYNFLRFFTFLSVDEIAAIEESDKSVQGRPAGQGVLAKEVTRLVHGEEGLASSIRITEALFSGDLASLTETDLAQLAQDGLPTTELDASEQTIVEILTQSELAKSNKMAREFIGNGAVSVNGEKVADSEVVLKKEDALFGKYSVIKRGKKLFNLYVWK
ncbi:MULTISPECIES: tyrosine--tRNA ligase [Aliivibrio]|uniref:Tyrosine--tRNA ligase n=1 Tax=Aliivibrio finisterrensis TaxID=511998 RepID=A0A4Q5KY27_9GAMM|nr:MULTISPECIES: tyrosine--tRNA ligase [Aliivibrio]MDD9174694.1 tyrosine--tRNA ligase [Aliivibrio sp. S3TY1]MDD9179106.1 tyrosine--tRNA ligase [Aliivibrio sp. A6]MDD9191773.1 tyrosine--tRNA ligase [Aliivibrio sp. S2TY2]RYU51570.1 tyrosine--tRNA ligase [Aliivibrio finisterrensis]RYU52795.1 tyrosine--tRNA ligase [Aliivibrio finisterrensis]